jgi:RNA polymerase sigma factor (sigma-70 family)
MIEYDRPSDEDVEKGVEVSMDYEGLLPVLETIHEAYREVIRMRFMDEMEIKEIAVALGKTPNNARVTLHRALAALKTQYEIQHNENSKD